ncbi:MAG: hypothetical protein A2137_04525 [Chloroflexi bacterium RBG_16_58_8]|nr:MAG: hypothetical protein A2137_04525 [Chloroflexi bacterium RBG_16_58_8]
MEPAAKAISAPKPEERYRLVINIRQTADKDGDIALLNRIIAALKASPGRDEVRLNVVNGGGAVPLKLPSLLTGYGPDLKQRLADLVGEDGWRVVVL